jgi:hypothetical protein
MTPRLKQEEEESAIGEEGNGDWSDIDWTDVWGCARGFAYGLQFSPAKEGVCYQSLDESIDAASDITALLLRSYQPWVWADILNSASSYMSFVSAVNANCDFQKLISTITTDVTTLVPALIARVGGGFIAEIPSRYLKMKKATTCNDLMQEFARIFSILLDYYI